MSDKLKWGLTEPLFREKPVAGWATADEALFNATSFIALLTVNGVPLADVLERCAMNIRNSIHPDNYLAKSGEHNLEQDAAVLRALVEVSAEGQR